MEKIKLNIVPSGANPTCYASQYDAGRVIRIELFDGLTPYTIKSGDTFTLNVRKPDNTIVTTSVTGTQGNNYIDITTTEQICACVGFNLCDLTITNGATKIGTLNFIMSVERDVLADGIPSESVIEDLDERIAEAIGDDYYNKTETDALLALKADKSTTYTKTETDNLLAAKANSSDVTAALALKANTADVEAALALKANSSDVEAALAEKANTSGEYDNLTVGNAKQLVSTVSEIDKTPYNFRTSGGTLDIGDRETDKLIGGSVAFNQLIPSNNNSSSKGGITATIAGYKLTLSGTVDSIPSDYNFYSLFAPIQAIANHKYIFATNGTINFYISNAAVITNNKIIQASSTGDMTIYPRFNSSWQIGDTINLTTYLYLIDLTQMFGSTIADYIYSLEQANTGAGVAYFRKLFPKPYYAYNAGELISVKTSAHVMTGFNQLDKNSSYVVGSYRYVNTLIGETNELYMSFTDKDTSVNISDLYVGFTSDNSNGTLAFNCVMINGEVRSNHSNISASGRTGVYCGYVFVYPNTADAWDRLNRRYDICVNIAWDGERNGEYEPYEVNTYPLDSDLELRGIPKLDANNKLYYDGDEYTSDGNVKRRYGIVDLGSLTWTGAGTDTSGLYRYESTGIANDVKLATRNLISTYPIGANNNHTNGTKELIVHPVNKSIVAWSDKATVSAFTTAMSGVYLIYELATPTTETADAYQNPQIVNDFGTEEYVDNRAVAIPVGHVTEYQPNLRAKLEMAPDSPQNNGDYLLRHNNGANEYVAYTKELPTAPTSDGTYKLVCTVSGGTPSYSWVSDT